jgi:hypothetical protein
MKLLKDAKPYVPSVPTEEDWGDYKSDLDQNYAHSVFAGRTNQEMQRSFWENVLERTSDLRWMPDVPFRYYMLGFRDFVMAKDFDCYGSDAASCFLGLILEKLENHPLAIIPIVQDLLPAAEYVAEHQAEFEADVEIYGNFSDKFAKIKMLFAKQRIL